MPRKVWKEIFEMLSPIDKAIYYAFKVAPKTAKIVGIATIGVGAWYRSDTTVWAGAALYAGGEFYLEPECSRVIEEQKKELERPISQGDIEEELDKLPETHERDRDHRE